MPEPITLERFAELTARMTSGGKRGDVLKAADVAEALWETSQDYWMGKMAAEAARDRFSLAQRYAALYKTAAARLSGIPMKLPRYPRKPQQQVVVHGVPAAPSNARSTSAAPPPPPPSAGAPSRSPPPAVVPPPPSMGSAATAAPPPSILNYTSRLTLEQLAAMRAEIGLASEAEHAGVMQRFGLDPTTWEREEAHWQRKLAGDQDLFKRYLKQFQYCRSLLLRT
jgi:hypothetical protein